MDLEFTGKRIGFASLGDATNPNYSSGAPYAMRQGFLDLGCSVVDIFPLDPPRSKFLRFQTILHRLNGEFYIDNRTPQALRRIAREVERRVADEAIDFLFSPHTIPVSMVESDVPIIVSHDQTFGERLAYFAYEARPPAKEYVEEAMVQEGLAFGNAALCVYPSQRSLDRIASDYGISRRKLLMAPWGANLPDPPTGPEADRMIARRTLAPLHITFVGVDWARKGGAWVVEACTILRALGLDVRLLIIGCVPPTPMPKWATIIPFLDRSRKEGADRYRSVMQQSHFLFMPSRVEAYGHVFCEAAAFGVPSIATDVGGIPTIIEDGESGICLPLESPPQAFADAIAAIMANRPRYTRMAHAARARFEDRLSWRSFCRTVLTAGCGIADEWAEGLDQPVGAAAN